MTTTYTMPAEYLHSVACQSAALIAAVENMRDTEGITAGDFAMMTQDNTPLMWAREYLNTGTMDCRCHAWDIRTTEDPRHHRGVCVCGWEGAEHTDPYTPASEARSHAQDARAAAWAAIGVTV